MATKDGAPDQRSHLHRVDALHRPEIARWLHGPLALWGDRDNWDEVVALTDALHDSDPVLATRARVYLLDRGLRRRVSSRLTGVDHRVYLALRREGQMGAGAYVCNGDDRGPGCGVVFLAARSAKRCPRCQDSPIPYKSLPGDLIRRRGSRFDPDRRLEYGRICEHCERGYWTDDPRQVFCEPACRVAAHRARVAA